MIPPRDSNSFIIRNKSYLYEYIRAKKLLPYECAQGMDYTRQMVESVKEGQSVGIFIGPEGGFDLEELSYAESAGWNVITLGKRILRAETAPLAALSVIMYETGNFD